MKNTAKPPRLSPQWQRRKNGEWPKTLTFEPWSCEAPSVLQAAKGRIFALESTNRWELVKKMVNPYEMVYTHEDPHFHPSIAVIKPLSRSYFKLIEILDALQFFEQMPKTIQKIRTAHIAEGPGGFIQAIADTAERNKKTLQQATAMTLKPTDQRVPGWRRASTFLHQHREVKLHYGADGTGDVYEVANQDSFVSTISPNVHFFTADGGFDFSVNYDIQEKSVYRLLVCSATTGLRCLQTDGSFVIKLFDIFSESTIILIGLMARCFKEWTLYKPALSRPCNSERYFLGRGFKALSPTMLESLLEIQKQCLNDMYPSSAADVLTEEERSYIRIHVETNTEEQIAAIQLAEEYAVHPEVWYTNQLPQDFQTSLSWCQRFRIPFTLTKPIFVNPVLYAPSQHDQQQSQLLDGDLDLHGQSGPTL